jgi:hypothetical protein
VAEDGSGNRATHPDQAPPAVHTFFVGTITALVEHDFESDQGWTAGVAGDDASTGAWERCDPEGTEAQAEDDHTPDPGVMAYITDCSAGSGQGSYDVDGGKTTLLSPIFDLSQQPNAHLRYYRWYSNDTGASPGADTLLVSASDDGGSSWTALELVEASQRSWKKVELDLADYVDLTSQVRLRFIASDFHDGSIVEAGVDDFAILVYEDGSSGAADLPEPRSAGLYLAPNAPNPFNPATTIHFGVPSSGARVNLSIYDVEGRRVVTLVDGEMASGPAAAVWNGRTGAGDRVAAGFYFVRLSAGEESLTRKILLLR